jgi:hypothetical protein
MAKTMSRKHNKKVANKSAKKRDNKSRKNIKRVSHKKHRTAHAKHVKFFHSRGHHNVGSYYGGKGFRLPNRSIARSRGIGGYKKMRGGMVSSPASGPVGDPWQGGNYVTPTPNYFAYSPNGIAVGGTELARSTTDDFIMKPPMNGGRKRNGHKGHKGQKGGFFQEIVNLGRGAQYGLNGGYFDLTGKQQPLSQNPYPTVQPFSNSDSSSTSSVQSMAPDVKQLYINANNQVLNV